MVFFTADLHLFHRKMLELRGFDSLGAMHDWLVEDWNTQVVLRDPVWVLGDVSFGRPEETAAILKDLEGRKHLVRGNHDKHMKDIVLQEFESVQDYKMLKVALHQPNGLTDVVEVALSHFPMLMWDKAHHGSLHFHGHSHGTLKYPAPNMRVLDVGVDSTKRALIEFGAAQTMMTQLGRTEFKKFDQHG